MFAFFFFSSLPRNVNHKFMWFSILVVSLQKINTATTNDFTQRIVFHVVHKKIKKCSKWKKKKWNGCETFSLSSGEEKKKWKENVQAAMWIWLKNESQAHASCMSDERFFIICSTIMLVFFLAIFFFFGDKLLFSSDRLLILNADLHNTLI